MKCTEPEPAPHAHSVLLGAEAAGARWRPEVSVGVRGQLCGSKNAGGKISESQLWWCWNEWAGKWQNSSAEEKSWYSPKETEETMFLLNCHLFSEQTEQHSWHLIRSEPRAALALHHHSNNSCSNLHILLLLLAKEKEKRGRERLDCISYVLPVPPGSVCDVTVILALRH